MEEALQMHLREVECLKHNMAEGFYFPKFIKAAKKDLENEYAQIGSIVKELGLIKFKASEANLTVGKRYVNENV